MPLYAIMYDRAGKPYKTIHSVFKYSEDNLYNSGNEDKHTLNYAHIMVVNVQNDTSHVGQFDNCNAHAFSIADSKKYYDTTKLKRRGR